MIPFAQKKAMPAQPSDVEHYDDILVYLEVHRMWNLIGFPITTQHKIEKFISDKQVLGPKISYTIQNIRNQFLIIS